MLQLVAARLDRRRGFVDQLQRRLSGEIARPEQQRQHLARGRSADGGRQEEFRMADELRARFAATGRIRRRSRAGRPKKRGGLSRRRDSARPPPRALRRWWRSARGGTPAAFRRRPAKALAWVRSSALGWRVSEKTTKAATLAAATGRRRRRARSAQRRPAPPGSARRSPAARAQGRPSAPAAARSTAGAEDRSSRANPAVMPATAPRAVPRRQKSPPRKAGAICATAANDRRPIDTSAACPARRS